MKEKMTNFRWTICVLLFVATTVNYLDRQVLSLTWPDFIAPQFGFTKADYSNITGCFTLAYAVAMLFAGKAITFLGTKKGYLWSIFIWSLAACAHALIGWWAAALMSVAVWVFLGCRFLLAVGEAGNMPAAVKTVAEYFPQKDRAFAASIFNAGSSVGAMAAPLLIPPLAKVCGWEWAFMIIGALGFLWMGFWVFLYDAPEKSARVNAAELAYIHEDDAGEPAAAAEPADERKVSFWKCFAMRPTWALIWGRVVTDGVWWFLLFWTPLYIKDQFGCAAFSGRGMSLMCTLYVIVTFLSIALCKLPTWFVTARGMRPFDGRMISMFLFACVPLCALGAQPLGRFSAWWPAVLIGVAAAGHQAWSANVFALIGDMYPKKAVAMLTGISQFASGLGSFLVNKYLAGGVFAYAEAQGEAFRFLGFAGNEAGYMVLFTYCAVAYLVGWTGMKALVPHYKKVEL